MLLLIISMIIATTAPSLSYECALILLIAVMGILCGKVRYSIIGTIVFLVLYLFTTLYLGNVTGTAYTMFTAWLSLVFKVYPCGMLAGIAVSTTRVNEFLSAMNKAHVPKKVVIPLAVMLRYLPTSPLSHAISAVPTIIIINTHHAAALFMALIYSWVVPFCNMVLAHPSGSAK